MPTEIPLLQRCFYHLRAERRISLQGPDSPTPEEQKGLRDCLYSCNGIDKCSGPNSHNGHSDPSNPPPEGALLNFCNGYISIGDVQSGKCVWRIKAQGINNRREPLNGYSKCLDCEECLPLGHRDCYEDVRDFIHIEEIFRIKNLRL